MPSLRRALPAADSCDTVLDFVFTLIIIIVVLVYCSDGNKAECGPEVPVGLLLLLPVIPYCPDPTKLPEIWNIIVVLYANVF